MENWRAMLISAFNYVIVDVEPELGNNWTFIAELDPSLRRVVITTTNN